MLSDEVIKTFKKKSYCIIQDQSSLIERKRYNYYKKVQQPIIDELNEKNTLIEIETKSYSDHKGEKYPQYTIYFDKNKVNIEIITSLTEFVSEILKIDNKPSTYIYYRGHSDWKYPFKPSIYREENRNILNNEDKMFRDIISSKPHFFNDCATTLEKLVKMQHHGLPTRLLDLTENPLIALFFACSSNRNKDKQGEVTVFNVAENKLKYYDSDTVSVLANLVKSPIEFDINRNTSDYYTTKKFDFSFPDKNDEKSERELLNEKEDILKLLHNIREDKPYFLDRIDPQHLKNYSLVVKPKMAIDRIINQSGAFVLYGINSSKRNCAEMNINVKGYKSRVLIIPSIFKEDILDQLKLFNINESSVFCDIDSTAKFFKDKYK